MKDKPNPYTSTLEWPCICAKDGHHWEPHEERPCLACERTGVMNDYRLQRQIYFALSDLGRYTLYTPAGELRRPLLCKMIGEAGDDLEKFKKERKA